MKTVVSDSFGFDRSVGKAKKRKVKRTVSVVIPIKGKENLNLLKRCVRSLFRQTVKPAEVVVVGDEKEIGGVDLSCGGGSKVSMRKIYAVVDKNEARNVGILNSRGDYVLYLDHDMAANRKLVDDCLEKAKKCGAVIIPEKGVGGGFWENCKRLEKELIAYDLHTVTPRFYKRSIFRGGEEPFDSRFGLLDEWGFNHKLVKKKVRLGYSDSFILVKERDFSVWGEVVNKFKRGLWIDNFYRIDKEEAWTRVNPIKRGLVFYSKKSRYFFKEPLSFLGLMVLKTIDFVAFFSGYLVGVVEKRREASSMGQDWLSVFDNLGERYLEKMFIKGKWNRYVDSKEKEVVSGVWQLEGGKLKEERILDLGMGPGRWSKFFLKLLFGRVVGVDMSFAMVNCAKEKILDKRFRAVEANIEELPFADKSFNRVFCFRAFKYVVDHGKAVREVERVLVPGGSFLLEVSNKTLVNRCLKWMSGWIVRYWPGLTSGSRWRYFAGVRFFSKKDLLKLLSEQPRLRVAAVMPIFVLPSVKMPMLVDKYGAGVLKVLDRCLFEVLPKTLFARSWVLLVRKEKR